MYDNPAKGNAYPMKPFRLPSTVIELAEVDGHPSAPKRVELMRAGRYERFERVISLDSALFTSLKKNFDEGIIKNKLAIDYSHESWGKASGWIEGVELSDDGKLFILADWTPTGRECLEKKEYRYISASIDFNYRDNETGKEYGPTLLGAGLTNRPFIRGMEPVGFSETSEGETEMTEQEIKDLKAQLKAEQDKSAALESKVTELAEKVSASDKAITLAEKKAKFDAMFADGKVCQAQREPFMNDDFTKFAELAQPVKLSEAGHGRSDSEEAAGQGANKDSKTPAQDKVLELAQKKRKEDGVLELDEAISIVLHEDPKLNAAYEKETTL